MYCMELLIPESGREGWDYERRTRLNQRQKARILLIFSVTFLAVTAILGVVLHDAAMVTDFSRKNIAPCLKYPFGTDWLGRNMFYRTLTGLSMSILIGVLAAGVSAVMALILGICAATLGKRWTLPSLLQLTLLWEFRIFCC